MSEVKVGSPLPAKLLEHEVYDAEGLAMPLSRWLFGKSMLVYLRHFG